MLEDRKRCISSSTLINYPHLIQRFDNADYLNLNLSLKDLKIIAQIRSVNTIYVILIKNGKCVTFDENKFRYNCGFPDNILHILSDCQIYTNESRKIDISLLSERPVQINSLISLLN